MIFLLFLLNGGCFMEAGWIILPILGRKSVLKNWHWLWFLFFLWIRQFADTMAGGKSAKALFIWISCHTSTTLSVPASNYLALNRTSKFSVLSTTFFINYICIIYYIIYLQFFVRFFFRYLLLLPVCPKWFWFPVWFRNAHKASNSGSLMPFNSISYYHPILPIK